MNFSGTVKLNPVGVYLLLGLSFICLLYIFASSQSSTREVSLKNLLIAAIHAAEKGGYEIKVLNEVNLNKQSKGKTKEGASDFVTDADFRSHCVMYYSLRYTFPFIKIISEEKREVNFCQDLQINTYQQLSFNSNNRQINDIDDVPVSAEDVTIWIDPLDATQEFTENLKNYVTTMVCVAVRGEPVIGVIHEPFRIPIISSWGWVGKGKSDNLRLSEKIINKEKPVIIISRSHSGNVSNFIHNAISNADVRTAGGAGYKILQLVKGDASAYVHTTAIKKWDVCAGNAILRSIGGRLSTLHNENIDYSNDKDQVVKTGILGSVFEHLWFYEKFRSVH